MFLVKKIGQYYKNRIYSRFYAQLLSIFVSVLFFFSGLYYATTNFFKDDFFARAALSPFTQTDWSGGTSSDIATGSIDTYLSSSNVDSSVSGEFFMDAATGWSSDYNSWAYRRRVTFDNTSSNLGVTSEVLNDFPVLIKLTSGINIDYSKTQDAGEDIRFTDSDGTVLDYEIETWDESGDSYIWVKVPQIDSDSDTDSIYMYYGNSSAIDGQNVSSVWTNGYLMVYHFNEASGTSGSGTVIDSTGNTSGTPSSGIAFEQSGQIGYASDFSSGTGINLGTIGDSLLDPTTTISFWIKSHNYSSPSRQNPYEQAYGGWGTMTLETDSRIRWFFGSNGNSGSPYTATVFSDTTGNNSWNYLTVVRDDSVKTHTWYKNGAYSNSASYTSSYPVIKDNTFTIGDGYVNPLNGLLDEFRVTNVTRSATWVAAEYKNQTDAYTVFESETSKYQNSGTLVSNIYDAGFPADWETLEYTTRGSGTVIVKVRSSNNNDMSSATDWSSCNGISSGSTLSDDSCVTNEERYIQYQVTLEPNEATSPVFEDITINFSASDQIAPDTQASAILVKTASDGSSISSYDDDNTAWTSDSDPYISWTAGADNIGGSGLLGYCVYVGTTSSSDPRSTKGQLGTSPVDTTNTDCDGGFITSTNSLDLSTESYQGVSWMSTSGDYYVILTAIDNSGNAAGSPFASFHYQYDGEAPTNVGYISAPSTVYGSVNDMTFNWPSSGGSISSDSHSGVLGWQYSLDGGSTWKGTSTHSSGFDYIPDNSSTYSYDLTEGDDGADISVGTNIVYFRTVDNAGNFSSAASYRTASLEYGGSAPTFAYNCTRTDGITVTPSTNTSNSYALSWDTATATGVNTISSYYYMINVSPPSSLSTLQSNSTQYIPVDTTTVSTKALTGSVKGTNTVYVVAVDSGDNYSPSNCVKGTYILNSSLPDAPKSLTAADSSIKSEEIWRASLSWSVPDYTGTGDLTYTIQRSENNSIWTDVTTTAGSSYTDTVTDSKTYYYRVGAYDTTDASEQSPTYTTSVSILPTGQFTEPAGLSSDPSVVGITTKRATINWSTSRTSDSRIQYGKSSGEYFAEEPSKSEQVTSHSIALTNLEPGTKYYYRAKWTDEDGNTGISDEQTFTTDPAPEITNPAVENISVSSATVRFTVVGASSVEVQYGRDTSFGGVSEVSTSVSESTYTVNLSGLEDGVQYYYRINTYDSEGDTYYGNNLSFETLPRPRISNIKIQQILQAAQPTVLVSWETNTEITSVVSYGVVGDTRQETDLELKTNHRVLLRSLNSDARYTLQVSGIDRAGNEATSDTQTFTTLTDTRAPQISNLVVRSTIKGNGDAATAQIIISWDTDEPSTSQVEFGQGTGSSYPQKSGEETSLKTNHTVVLTNLSPSQVYHLRALSKDSNGNLSESVDNVTVTPKSVESALDLVVTNLTEVFGFIRR